MLTYSFDDRGSDSLYEYLYKSIRNDILSCKLNPGEKLPSKRALAKHLGVSCVTVENAYGQLMAEGYIYSVAKSGFFVSEMGTGVKYTPKCDSHKSNDLSQSHFIWADFISNSTRPENFPFALWARLMRKTMSDEAEKLMVRSPSQGIEELRRAIASHLAAFRGMRVDPENIIVGAGTEYLYGLIIQLLGRELRYAVEDPGYRSIARIYAANDVSCSHIPMDSSGIDITELRNSGAQVLHISPSHHFPSGLVTPISRRYELLSWACGEEGRYIIEDDYDSEFRLWGKPIPALQSIDASGKVIYVNTFSKSLSSTVRISYMVLPPELMARYREKLSFYSCTVPNFEQYTLARFISEGYFEKHINRMRNYYRGLRDSLITALRDIPGCKVREEDSGLHFLMKIGSSLPDEEIVSRAYQKGIALSALSQYYSKRDRATDHVLVLNYSGMDPKVTAPAITELIKIISEE